MPNKVFVVNLPWKTSEHDLRTYVSQFCDVEEVKLPADRVTLRPRGFAFVQCRSAADAEHLIAALDGAMFQGRELRAELAIDAPRRSA